jgi:hypothetical protein
MTYNWIFLIIILIIGFYITNIYRLEPYYDITPYNLNWNIFSCLDRDCAIKAGYECYKWCDSWTEDGGKENCRLRCLDNTDLMLEQLKVIGYQFNKALPRFKKYSLLTNNDYF